MVPILFGAFILEHRAYNESDTSEEEIKAIQSRITLLEDGIVHYLELPIMTEYSINLLFDELEKKMDACDCKGVIIDLSMINIPNIGVRKQIFSRFERIIELCQLISFATGMKSLTNVAIKFFLNSRHSNLKVAMFSQTKEEALKKIYEKLGKK